MSALGLSDVQLAERKKGIGGSDAGKIMSGDWRALWAEKTGRAEPEDLSDNLAVQMGSATEAFNAMWFERRTGRPIYSRNELAVSVRYPFMRANLDGITTTSKGAGAYWDAKHVGRLDEATVLRYTPQMTHCCTILGLDWWVLSVFIGNSKWEMVEQEIDPMYQAELIAKEQAFWQFVWDDIEPPEADRAPVLAPKPQPKRRMIDVPLNPDDPVFAALMQRDNWLSEMVEAMGAFATTEAARKRNAIARKDMDRLMPEDVGEVRRGRIKAKRDGRGFTATLDKEPSDAAGP